MKFGACKEELVIPNGSNNRCNLTGFLRHGLFFETKHASSNFKFRMFKIILDYFRLSFRIVHNKAFIRRGLSNLNTSSNSGRSHTQMLESKSTNVDSTLWCQVDHVWVDFDAACISKLN